MGPGPVLLWSLIIFVGTSRGSFAGAELAPEKRPGHAEATRMQRSKPGRGPWKYVQGTPNGGRGTTNVTGPCGPNEGLPRSCSIDHHVLGDNFVGGPNGTGGRKRMGVSPRGSGAYLTQKHQFSPFCRVFPRRRVVLVMLEESIWSLFEAWYAQSAVPFLDARTDVLAVVGFTERVREKLLREYGAAGKKFPHGKKNGPFSAVLAPDWIFDDDDNRASEEEDGSFFDQYLRGKDFFRRPASKNSTACEKNCPLPFIILKPEHYGFTSLGSTGSTEAEAKELSPKKQTQYRIHEKGWNDVTRGRAAMLHLLVAKMGCSTLYVDLDVAFLRGPTIWSHLKGSYKQPFPLLFFLDDDALDLLSSPGDNQGPARESKEYSPVTRLKQRPKYYFCAGLVYAHPALQTNAFLAEWTKRLASEDRMQGKNDQDIFNDLLAKSNHTDLRSMVLDIGLFPSGGHFAGLGNVMGPIHNNDETETRTQLLLPYGREHGYAAVHANWRTSLTMKKAFLQNFGVSFLE